MKILIVDDHALFRDGMKFLLQELSDSVEILEAEDCESAIISARETQFKLVLMDLKMPGSSGVEALVEFRHACPESPVVVLSGEGTPSIVRDAIQNGAMGFLAKSSNHEIMIHALKLVLSGGIYLPASVLALSDPIVEAQPKIESLTERQLEVLRNLIEGKTNKVIARNMDVSEHTIKAHLSTVFSVLGAKSRTEAVYKAAKLGVKLF
jgi:DNA-binding NarL/FixJ family response regulator